MNRRELIATGMAGASAALLPSLGQNALAHAAAPANRATARLALAYDRLMADMLDRSPETVTSLGLDKGVRLAAKGALDDRSLGAIASDIKVNKAHLVMLRAIDRKALSGLERTNYDSLVFDADVRAQSAKLPFAGSPYVITQLSGAYQSVPDFLDSQHSVENSADAEAYLSRLSGFATAIDQENEQIRHDTGLGVSPPDFVLQKALEQLKALRDAPAQSANLVLSLSRRAAAKNLAGDWQARASAIYTSQIQPALSRQIALLEAQLPGATHVAGVGRLPQGEEIYRIGLLGYTTSTMSPEDIHRTGLDLIASLSAQLDTILRTQGLTQGSVGERLHALYLRPDQLYANTDAAKVQLIADLNGLVRRISARLPEYFGALPKASLDIKRIPPLIEAGAPGGYYQNASLDGKRPGAYYINLRDTTEVPRWLLPTLTFHEGIPGHHLQVSLAQEAALPDIRRTQGFSGYVEGWALYAEQLAVEMGFYDDDPLGHIGQLHDAMFRAVRLVVDSGMHAKGWSRERATAFYCATLGTPQSAAVTEIDRYCVWPGQACSYMLGKLAWLRARDRAKAALGARFDIRRFHDAGLLAGAMPLTVLEGRIEEFIAAGG